MAGKKNNRKRTVAPNSKTATKRPKRLAKPVERPVGVKPPPAPAPVPTPARVSKKASDGLVPVVGIGSSAGGLEALTEFFDNVPANTGLAYVVVTHHQAGHESLLAELLGAHTRMPVSTARESDRIRPDCVYLSPPGMNIELQKNTLHVALPDRSSRIWLPIDHFFRSLAASRMDTAACIVLSGTGSDGTVGLLAVKNELGMVMAQEVASARYSGMPESAIGTGQVDFVLPARDMPSELLSFAHRTSSGQMTLLGEEPPVDGIFLKKLLTMLARRTGHDFSSYKSTTMFRRIERRMNVHKKMGPGDYLQYVQENPFELDLLFKELLVSVTSFFRDPKAFEALTAAIDMLMESKADDSPLRVWVPGCATGEEAYSIAIIVRERMDRLKRHFKVQIFGTDLDLRAIETARAGRYPDGIAADVSPNRLDRYFTKDNGAFRISPEIREIVTFAPQSVIKDPPFTKMDLISCRNLMIYLESDMQKRLLPLFHYALNPRGILFLGPSESISGAENLFKPVDRKWKIFERKASPVVIHPAMLGGRVSAPRQATYETATQGQSRQRHDDNLPAVIEKILVKRFAPPSVVVNDRGDIVYIYGRTGPYLEPATGKPALNIVEMAREGLRYDLMSAIRKTSGGKGLPVQKQVRIKTGREVAHVILTVSRLDEPDNVRGLLLVTFEPVASVKLPPYRNADTAKTRRDWTAELELELRHTKETLRTTIEDLETSNEELRSTNEELQSTNEEMQSANEELETSREEMQSLNEELQTVNAELQTKVEELSSSNDDMQNLLNSTGIATLFLDNDLKIRRFTRHTTKVINLIDSDTGRPISDLVSNFKYDSIKADSLAVLRDLVPSEREIQAKDGSWYLMRMVPYRTAENVIEGLVITFVDISRIKRAESEAVISRAARLFAENVVNTVREPLVVLDLDFHVISANSSFYRAFQLTPESALHQNFYSLKNRIWDIPEMRHLLQPVAEEGKAFENYRFTHDFPDIGTKVLILNARRLTGEPGLPDMILLALEVSSAKVIPA